MKKKFNKEAYRTFEARILDDALFSHDEKTQDKNKGINSISRKLKMTIPKMPR